MSRSQPHALPPSTPVDLDGVTIATYILDPLTADPAGDVVLCHGTPWSAAVWEPVAQALRRTHRVLLWDMPGYGASIGAADQEVDLVSQRRRLAALLDHWGLTSPHVIAHDIGGAVALGPHLFEGRDYASLYLLDIVSLEPWGSPFFRLVAQHQDVFSALPAPLHAALVREYISGAAGTTLDPARLDELTRPWLSPHGQRAFYRQIAHLDVEHTRPVVAGLNRVRCPVRIGWGAEDPWIPSSQATELAALLPGPVEVATFPDAGHLVPLEATDTLAADLLAWLGAAGERRA